MRDWARGAIRAAAWELGRMIGRWRGVRTHAADVRRFVYRDQTGRMGVRMTEGLRDRLRRGWVRLRRSGD